MLTFNQTQVLACMRSVAASVEDRLGFSPHEIGTRSIRTSAAMGWFLAREHQTKIKLMGRWKSEAWQHYLRKQIMEFGKGMAAVLLKNEHFHSLLSLSDDSLGFSSRLQAVSFWFNGLSFLFISRHLIYCSMVLTS